VSATPATERPAPQAPTVPRPSLVFFYSPQSGPSRRVEGFLAQVLQRRRNHDTFRVYRVDVESRPDLVSQFAVPEVPALAVVEQKVVQGVLPRPRGCREIEAFLRPWLQ
jgi:thioredoxin-like negative regulator of GroEL